MSQITAKRTSWTVDSRPDVAERNFYKVRPLDSFVHAHNIPRKVHIEGGRGSPGKAAASPMLETWRWCALAGVSAQR